MHFTFYLIMLIKFYNACGRPKKIRVVHTKAEDKDQYETQKRWKNQIRNDIKKGGKLEINTRKQEVVDTNLRKRLKNDETK